MTDLDLSPQGIYTICDELTNRADDIERSLFSFFVWTYRHGEFTARMILGQKASRAIFTSPLVTLRVDRNHDWKNSNDRYEMVAEPTETDRVAMHMLLADVELEW